jgi:hypothetical protein
MALYNVAEYGDKDGVPYETDEVEVGDFYGDSPRLQYSAEPVNSTAISYTQISLTWLRPSGSYTDFRVVRSNDGFPETAEDGAIIYSWNDQDTDPFLTDFIDGDDETKQLISGRFIYYRMWLKIAGNTWRVAGDSYALLPVRHATFAPDGTVLVSTKNKVLDVLPRVYTTASQSPIDEISENSDLARFLEGPSFELDRILTYAELLLPLESGRYVSPEILMLQSLQLGLPLEPFLATKQQRRLAREALYIYQNKGTAISIGAFVESLTGFSPEITKSPNLVLSTQDSSFTGGIGFWQPAGNLTIELDTTIPGVPPEGVVGGPEEPYVDDYRYVAKVISNQVGSRITTGLDDPVRKGTPVDPGTAYIFSGYGKAASGTIGVTGYAYWYDISGNLIDIDPPKTFIQDPQEVDTDWTRFEFIGRTPGVVQDIAGVSITSGVITLYLNSPNIMVRGETIRVSGTSEFIDGIYQIESVGLPTGSEFNQVRIKAALPDSPYFPVQGTLTETIPNTLPTAAELAVQVPSGTLDPKWAVIAASITDGIATVTFGDENDEIDEDDLIVLQAVNTTLSFGVHTVLTKVNAGGYTTVTFQLYVPYTGPEITDDSVDGSWTATGTPYGFSFKVLPNTGVPSPKGHYAGFELIAQDTGTIYFDLFQMATYDVEEFHEARGVEIFLYPTKTNYLLNPGFNPAGMSNWDVAAATYDNVDRTDLELVGSGYSLELDPYASVLTTDYSITANVATVNTVAAHNLNVGDIFSIVDVSPPISTSPPYNIPFTVTAKTTTSISFALPSPVNVTTTALVGAIAPVVLSTVSDVVRSGKFITTSIYAKTGTSTPEPMVMNVVVYDGVAEEIVKIETKQIVLTDKWQRFEATVFVPKVEPESVVINMSFAGVMSGQILYFDHAQVEDSFTASDYFDGDLPPSYGAVWGDLATPTNPTAPYKEADPYDSPSHLYPNLYIKVTRLQQELEKYLPLNSSFLIRWYGGGLAKPLL